MLTSSVISLVFLHNEVFVMVVRLRSGEVTASQGSLLCLFVIGIFITL